MNELTLIQGQTQLNAIDAVRSASTTSSKYGFISSRSIIDNLTTLGFTPRKIQIHKVRKDERQGFQRHIVRLQHQSLMPKVGDSFPEIVLINSHDGGSSYRMLLGIYRLVCTNGMVSGNTEDEIRYTHRKANLSLINDGVMRLVNRASELTDKIAQMTSRELTLPEQASFVEEAIKLRYRALEDDSSLKDVHKWNNRRNAVNEIRRHEDSGSNLWLTFNRIQENLTQGSHRGSGIRRITSPSADLNVNRSLWNLAESFLN
jgi:hypothetical protein